MPAPTMTQLDEYYDDLIYEEATGMTMQQAYEESCAEIEAENAWLRHAESQGMSHHEELREEGLA